MTWCYRLESTGPSGTGPAERGVFLLMLVIVPLWWTWQPEDNVKFVFNGEELVEIAELQDHGRGGYCSLIGGHPFEPGCHGEK